MRPYLRHSLIHLIALQYRIRYFRILRWRTDG